MTETIQHVSLEKAQHNLGQWLAQEHDTLVVITKQGNAIGVLLSPSAYAHLRRIQAYFGILQMSRSLQDCGITAEELYRLSREDLEVRG